MKPPDTESPFPSVTPGTSAPPQGVNDESVTPPLPPSKPPFQPPLPAEPHPSELAPLQKYTYPCRDFSNGFCKRGSTCRFSHDDSKQREVFCHDYQNGKCTRGYCKFLHSTREEEAEYHKTGKIPKAAFEKYKKLVCPDFVAGKCSNADCGLQHVKKSVLNSMPVSPMSQPPPPPMTQPPPPGPPMPAFPITARPPPPIPLTHPPEPPPILPPIIYTQAPPVPTSPIHVSPPTPEPQIPQQPPPPILQRGISPITHPPPAPPPQIIDYPTQISNQTNIINNSFEFQNTIPPPTILQQRKDCEKKKEYERVFKTLQDVENKVQTHRKNNLELKAELMKYLDHFNSISNEFHEVMQDWRTIRNNELSIQSQSAMDFSTSSDDRLKDFLNQRSNNNLNQGNGDIIMRSVINNNPTPMVAQPQINSYPQQISMSQNQLFSNYIQQPLIAQRQIMTNTIPQQSAQSNQIVGDRQQFMNTDWKKQYLASDRPMISQPSSDIVSMQTNQMVGHGGQQFMRSNSIGNQQDMINVMMNTSAQQSVSDNSLIGSNSSQIMATNAIDYVYQSVNNTRSN